MSDEKWFCVGCGKSHSAKTPMSTTSDGQQFCNKWESLEQQLEAFMGGLTAEWVEDEIDRMKGEQ